MLSTEELAANKLPPAQPARPEQQEELLLRRKVFACLLLSNWERIETDNEMFRMELLARVPWGGSQGVFDLAVPKGIVKNMVSGEITIIHPDLAGGLYIPAGKVLTGIRTCVLLRFMQMPESLQLFAWEKLREQQVSYSPMLAKENLE